MATTPEGRVKHWVDMLFREFDVWWFNPHAGPFGKAGVPDKIACVYGQFLAVECKADTTKAPTALQNKTMTDIRNAHGRVFLVRCKEDLAPLRAYLEEVHASHRGG